MAEHIALYFAYGSNMNQWQMAYRCPNAEPLGEGKLAGWQMAERMYADIEPAEGKAVHGLVWAVTSRCIRSLDRYEGFPTTYIRDREQIELRGKRYPAFVYIMTPEAIGNRWRIPFSDQYAAACIAGAIDSGVTLSPILKAHRLRIGKRLAGCNQQRLGVEKRRRRASSRR